MPQSKDEVIRLGVIGCLAVMSGSIKDSQKLYSDLGLDEDQRGALAPCFRKIARVYKAKAPISKKECKSLATVEDCVALVQKRA